MTHRAEKQYFTSVIAARTSVVFALLVRRKKRSICRYFSVKGKVKGGGGVTERVKGSWCVVSTLYLVIASYQRQISNFRRDYDLCSVDKTL